MFYKENKLYSRNNYIGSQGCDCFLYTGCDYKLLQKIQTELLFSYKLQVQWEIMKLKKTHWIKSFFLSFSSGLQRSTSGGRHLTWHFFSSLAKVWPYCGAVLVIRKGQSFSSSQMVSLSPVQSLCAWVDTVPGEAQLGCALLGGLRPCCADTPQHKSSQTHETWWDFTNSRCLAPLEFILLSPYCTSTTSQP